MLVTISSFETLLAEQNFKHQKYLQTKTDNLLAYLSECSKRKRIEKLV